MDELSTALHEYEKERDFQRGLVDAMHIAQYGSPCPLIERLTSAIARAEAAGVVTFGCEPWEDGEYVITANKSVVGCTVARSAAPEIIRWVATAWAELIKANTAALNAAQQKGPA
jgi:hypothetical protein